MKVIFLDMDGVLNSHAYMTSRRTKAVQEAIERQKWEGTPEQWAMMVDPEAVKRLNTLIKETGAKIVISSSWRHEHSPEQMQRILELAGLVGVVIDQTPVMPGPRAHEIASWLASRPGTKKFVILDDNTNAGEGMNKWFVNTSMATGLTDADVRTAINILGRK